MMQTFLSPPASLPSCGNVDLTPPPPPLLPPPRLPVLAVEAYSHSAPDDASDLTEEIRRSLENLDAIIQLHDDEGLTEQEMLNLPAPAPELLEFPDSSPKHYSYPSENSRRPPPPPAPPRRSSIKQQTGEQIHSDNGHAMTEQEEEVGIDQSSRSVADILQKFSRANTPPKVPTVPPALRTKSISSTPDVVPPPAAFRTPAPVNPSAPALEPVLEPALPPPPPEPTENEKEEKEDFGFARLRKLAEMSSSTGEDVHKRGALQRSKTVDVTSSRPVTVLPIQNRESVPEPPPSESERRASAPGADDEGESFAFARLRALAEQQSNNPPPGNEDSDSMNDSDNDLDIDLSKVPGYIRIDARLPNWKRSMVEKKNKEVIEAYLKAKEEEEKERRKWANVPAWKRNLVQKKQQDRKPEVPSKEENKQTVADPNLPAWKRNIVERRKSGDEARR